MNNKKENVIIKNKTNNNNYMTENLNNTKMNTKHHNLILYNKILVKRKL